MYLPMRTPIGAIAGMLEYGAPGLPGTFRWPDAPSWEPAQVTATSRAAPSVAFPSRERRSGFRRLVERFIVLVLSRCISASVLSVRTRHRIELMPDPSDRAAMEAELLGAFETHSVDEI